MPERSRKGLVLRDVKVKRGGKTFTQKRWVKAGNDEPEEKKKKKIDDPKGKGKFNVGDIISFMGSTLTIEKISEIEGTFKLSDGGVYTMGALDKFAKPIDETKEKEPSVKDLKVRKKKPEKEIKRVIPVGTIITEKNAEEILMIGARITMRGKGATVTNKNGSIIEYTNQDGTKNLGSIQGMIDEGVKVRDEDKSDINNDKKRQKIITKAEKKIRDREKRFSKVRKLKQIGAKSPIKLPKVGDNIEVIFGRIDKVESITPDEIIVGGSSYDHDEIHEIISEGKPLVTGDKVSGNYKFTGDKKKDAKISETINKLDNLMLDGKSLDGAIKEIVSGKKGTLKSKVDLPEFEKGSLEIVKKGISKLNTYLSPKFDDLEIEIVPCTTGRSYATTGSKQIHLNDDFDMDSTVMHETGHIIEDKYEGIRNVIDDFLRSRTGNLSDQKSMDELMPGMGYRKDEVSCRDDFISAYIGKIYYKRAEGGEIDTKDLGASEILSMGIQKFTNESEMREFYNRDKEHFALTLSIIAGDFIE